MKRVPPWSVKNGTALRNTDWAALWLCVTAEYLAACSPDVIAELVNELLAAREIQQRKSGEEYRLRFLLDSS